MFDRSLFATKFDHVSGNIQNTWGFPAVNQVISLNLATQLVTTNNNMVQMLISKPVFEQIVSTDIINGSQ